MQAMRYRNKVKRVADILEKLGVGGMILGVFRDEHDTLWLAIVLLIISLLMTREE